MKKESDAPSILVLRTAFTGTITCQILAVLGAIKGDWGLFAIAQFWTILGSILFAWIRSLRRTE